jgi:hypothetical protein
MRGSSLQFFATMWCRRRAACTRSALALIPRRSADLGVVGSSAGRRHWTTGPCRGMLGEFSKKDPRVPLVDRNQKIETLSTNCSNQPLTERICLGSSDWRLQHAHAEAVQLLIESQRKNAVPVVNDESVWMIEGQEFPETVVSSTRRSDVRSHCNAEFGANRSPSQQTRTEPGMMPVRARMARTSQGFL